jgi:hypothetical protein
MKKLIMIGILVLGSGLMMGNSNSCATQTDNSYANDAAKVEETQGRVQKTVPIPVITTSAERKNISARATLFDNENKTTYIYLISFGKVMAFYPVKGKVSSLNSYLTPVDKLVKWDGSTCDWNISNCFVVSAPDIDGAYGENANGIFFFTADTGAYVEWNDSYLVSDQPLHLSTAVELTREIK